MGMVIHSVSHVVVAVVGSQHERARVVARVLDPKGRVGLLGCLLLI
jgi:predicted amino acid dehydrogenase